MESSRDAYPQQAAGVGLSSLQRQDFMSIDIGNVRSSPGKHAAAISPSGLEHSKVRVNFALILHLIP